MKTKRNTLPIIPVTLTEMGKNIKESRTTVGNLSHFTTERYFRRKFS